MELTLLRGSGDRMREAHTDQVMAPGAICLFFVKARLARLKLEIGLNNYLVDYQRKRADDNQTYASDLTLELYRRLGVLDVQALKSNIRTGGENFFITNISVWIRFCCP